MLRNGLVAFGFGVPSTIWSNQEVARIAALHAREDNAVIFTQKDVQFTADQRRDLMIEYFPDEVPNKPPPTLRIARWVMHRVEQEGVGEITVVAARPHIWRAMRDTEMVAKEAGFGQILIAPAAEIWASPEAKWYCKDSTQERARSRQEWREREAILEMMPWGIYKNIAS